MGVLRLENQKMRTQLEEILERGALVKQQLKNQVNEDEQMDFNINGPNPLNFMDQTIEQLSIFQNKEIAHFRNIDLENIQKDQKYVKRLELSIENLNEKLSKLKGQMQKQK